MEQIDEEFIELYRTIGNSMGLDNLTSTIFAKLCIEPEKIAMEDLAKETGYSLSSISNKARMLEGLGIIHKITEPGNRKVYLYMEKDFTNIMVKQLKKKQEYEIKPAKRKIPEIIKNNNSRKNQEKIKILKDYHSQILKMEELFNNLIEDLKKIK